MPAASIVLDVGGLEFLTLLRPNVDKELQPIVDDILDCLFHLPSAEDEVHAPECIYQHQARAGMSQILLSELCINALPVSST